MKPNYREIDPQSLHGIEACSLKGSQQPMQFAAMLQELGVKEPAIAPTQRPESIASILPTFTPGMPS